MVMIGVSAWRFLTENHGRWRATGSSSWSRPASRSCRIAVAVNSVVIEATRLRVSGVAGARRAGSASPNPAAHSVSWSRTIPIEEAGQAAVGAL